MQIKKIIPLLILIVGAVTFYFAGGSYYFNFEFLRSQSSFLQEFVTNHYLASMLIFIGAYIFITAFSLPIASLMTLVGGFLFGAYLGTLYPTGQMPLPSILLQVAARKAPSLSIVVQSPAAVMKLALLGVMLSTLVAEVSEVLN